MEQYWGSENYVNYFTKLENCVYSTKDEILLYDNDLILPVFLAQEQGIQEVQRMPGVSIFHI